MARRRAPVVGTNSVRIAGALSTQTGGSVEIRGLQELLKTLNEQPLAVAEKSLVGGCRKMANIIAGEARRQVPVDTGNLRKGIGVQAPKTRNKAVSAIPRS